MLTKRRQLRRKQTRRRASRRQSGGGTEEDYEIIRAIHREITNPAAMIAAIYTTRGLYSKCTDYPPASPIGSGVIPDAYARPDSHMKPLNSVLRCAYNFFNLYAGKARGSDSEPAEWEMAKRINQELAAVFQTFINTELMPSRGKTEKAGKLFRRIQESISAKSWLSAAPATAAAAAAPAAAATALGGAGGVAGAAQEEREKLEKAEFLRRLNERANAFMRAKGRGRGRGRANNGNAVEEDPEFAAAINAEYRIYHPSSSIPKGNVGTW